jgi:hypothetical protein
MNGLETARLPVVAPAADAALPRLNPYLHHGPGRFYNPLTDRTLVDGQPGFAALAALARDEAGVADLDPAERHLLAGEGWLVAAGADPSRAYRLKYVSLEAHTVCNQACYFCPVSVDPREAYFMPLDTYERIVGELAAYRDTIESVFMINYNEPTADKRFVDQVAILKRAGLPPAVLTNGSGLTPKRIDRLVEMGGLKYLSINLSTLDRDHYRATRRGDHLGAVMRNLDYARDRPVAETMEIVVLGTGDDKHRADFAEIRDRFAGSRFGVQLYEVMDRAGYLQIGRAIGRDGRSLCGCENVGSRPLQHLHITPYGKCVLCCEDYDENYAVGDLTRQSVAEVLAGPEIARLRRWAYGVEEAPDDFICRKCVFALKR